MRIAQIAPLYESVPPKGYGGTERVVSWLTEELVRMGHDVTLFATGDSQTKARLVAGSPRALREMDSYGDALVHHYLMMEKLWKTAEEFDFIHAHLDYLTFPFFRAHKLNAITTLHGRLDIPSLEPLYREYKEIPLVSISNTQRAALPFANWQATVYHGLPDDLYTFTAKPEDYLLFLGRICPEKGVDKAIEIATRAGIPLKIAAKVDPADVEYFETVIKPLLDTPGVEFLGEASQSEKNELIGNALAMLFPINWPEPFGLVMIEAMACGTPIIAFNHGSVSEVMEHGKSGFICSSIDEAVHHLKDIDRFDRAACREVFDRRFSVAVMANAYSNVYEQIVQKNANRRLLFFGKFSKGVNVNTRESEVKQISG